MQDGWNGAGPQAKPGRVTTEHQGKRHGDQAHPRLPFRGATKELMSDFPPGEESESATCAELPPGHGWERKEGLKDAKPSALPEAALSLSQLSGTYRIDPCGHPSLDVFIVSLPEVFILTWTALSLRNFFSYTFFFF